MVSFKFISSALTSKPDWNLLGIIELGTEEFVKRCVEDVVELEEGLDDELQVELDNAAVLFVFGVRLETMEFGGDTMHVGTTSGALRYGTHGFNITWKTLTPRLLTR